MILINKCYENQIQHEDDFILQFFENNKFFAKPWEINI